MDYNPASKDVGGSVVFYEAFADSYDDMINWSSRLQAEQADIQQVFKEKNIKTIIDAGCGTGIHSIVFAKMGLKVIALDNTEEMLKVAQKNAERYKVTNVDFRLGEFTKLTKVIPEKVDCLVCLGNSLPHLVDDEEIHIALSEFFNALEPGGFFILQMVHFDHYLDSADSAVAVTEGTRRGQKVIFRRHYEFKGTKVIFHVSVYDRFRRELVENFNAPLNAIRKDLLMNFMERAGFVDVSVSRDFSGAPVEDKDRSLVLFARKPREGEEPEEEEG